MLINTQLIANSDPQTFVNTVNTALAGKIKDEYKIHYSVGGTTGPLVYTAFIEFFKVQ